MKADLGDNEGAILDYNRVIELVPNHSTAYANRAFLKEESGDKEGALEDYNKAIPRYVTDEPITTSVN